MTALPADVVVIALIVAGLIACLILGRRERSERDRHTGEIEELEQWLALPDEPAALEDRL
jgi:hypothetical protein